MGRSVHLIYRDRSSGGSLWQGGQWELERLDPPHNVHYDFVVMAARDYQPEIMTPEEAAITPPRPREDIYTHLDRIVVDHPPKLLRIALHEPVNNRDWSIFKKKANFEKKLLQTASIVAKRVKDGQKVLSSCWGGVNRSGLISCLAVKILRPDYKMQDIVDAVQNKRAFALSVPYLAKLLLDMERKYF